MAPSRCTQNPTFGEEWRRGWHPERIEAKNTEDEILVVGSGPAGLEAARALGQRGYRVLLAEAATELGGRVSAESRLPGLAAWARVRDHRLAQLDKLPNVEVFLDSRMGADDVLETGCSLVAVATGCRWRRDGVGRHTTSAIPGSEQSQVLTPDDIMAGVEPSGPVVVYEDDHYYMASVVAEKLAIGGVPVTIVTPAFTVARFTEFTLELAPIHRRLAELGVRIMPNHGIQRVAADHVQVEDIYSGAVQDLGCAAVVMVAGRSPVDDLYRALAARSAGTPRAFPVGDCRAPGTIAAAVYSGHQFARDLHMEVAEDAPFLREEVALASLSEHGAGAG